MVLERRDIPLFYWSGSGYNYNRVDEENVLCTIIYPYPKTNGEDTLISNGMIANYNFIKDKWTILHMFPLPADGNVGPFSYGPNNVQMVNDSVGYGMHARQISYHVDSNMKFFDVFFRTRDGNKTWEKTMDTFRIDTPYDIQNLKFYDEKNGIIVGRNGKVLMTNDGGDTWVLEDPKQFSKSKVIAVMFVDWAGQFPIISTRLDGDIYRYEGNFFKFDFKSPELFYPKDKTLAVEFNPLFRWEELRDATSYKYELSNTSDFKTIVWELSGKNLNYKYNTLEPFTDYWWRVSSTDGKETKVSAPAKFRTKMPLITTSSPECSAKEQDFTVKFNWQSVKGAEKYRIRLSKDSKFGTITHDKDEILDLETKIPNLDELTTYFWQVQPYRSDESGDWSNVCSFTTKKSTGVANNSTNDKILLTPNPASDFIEISLPSSNHTLQGVVETENVKVQIFNTLGIEVGQSSLIDDRNRIDISHLPVGVYFVKIQVSNGACSIVEKFVKM